MEIRLLKRLIDEVEHLIRIDVMTSDWSRTIDKQTKMQECVIKVEFHYDKGGKLWISEKFEVPLTKKVETIVKYGDHQGFNEEDEPIVINYKWRENFEVINDIIALGKAFDKEKDELIKNKIKVEEIQEGISKKERKIKERINKNKNELIESLTENERLLPEILILEKDDIEDGDI